MNAVRWCKVIRDLLFNKARTGLVIAAIALGVFGTGTILNAYSILTREMNKNYMETNPASFILTVPTANAVLLGKVRAFPGVKDAELRKMVQARLRLANGDWQNCLFFGVENFRDQRMDLFKLEDGTWPTAPDELLIERAALPMTGAGVGEKLWIKMPGQPLSSLKVTGTVHAPGLPPAWMENIVWGFASPATLRKIGDSGVLEQVRVVVTGDRMNKTHIGEVALHLKGWSERQGYPVQQIEIPSPGKHPHADQMAALLFLLQCFGALTLVLSGVLVANTMNAILAREMKTIGVMKTLGAGSHSIMAVYLGLVIVPGLIALTLAIPAAIWAGRCYAAFASEMLNFVVMDASIPFWTYLIQVMIGLLVPVLAALGPVLHGCGMTVKDALIDRGTSRNEFKIGSLTSWFEKLSFINRFWLLAIRNAFRRRGRLILTVATLAAGGAILIVAVNIFGSIEMSVDNTLKTQGYAIRMRFDRPYEAKKIERIALGVPQVRTVESWGGDTAVFEGPRGLDGVSFPIDALPDDSQFLHRPCIAGRWLKVEDRNALVINQGLRSSDPQFEVGRKVRLRIGGHVANWRIIGIIREIGSEPRAYANRIYFDQYLQEAGQVRSLVVTTHLEPRRSTGKTGLLGHIRHPQTTPAAETAQTKPIRKLLEERMEANGFFVTRNEDAAGFRRVLAEHLKIIAVFLIMMSLLTVFIGGLGLATSMSINVIERMREIGIMRSIGGAKRTIVRLYIKEGIVVGLMSWFVSIILSIPLTPLIGTGFGNIFFQTPLDLSFGHHGVIAWLALMILVTVAASYLSARQATQLTVGEVLAYE